MYSTFPVKKGEKSTHTNNTIDPVRIYACLNKYMKNDLKGHTPNTQERVTIGREGN